MGLQGLWGWWRSRPATAQSSEEADSGSGSMRLDLWPLVPLTVLLQCALSLVSILYLHYNRSKAKQGDRAAAQVVILPNFKYLLWTCLICQLVHFVLVGHHFTQMPDWKKRSRFNKHEVTIFDTSLYFTAILVTSIEYNAAGALLFQNSLAKSAFEKSRQLAILWGIVFAFFSSVGFYANSNTIFFTIDAIFYTLEIAFYGYMIHRASNSMRNACIWYAWYSIFWRILIVPTAILDVCYSHKEAYHAWVAFRSLLFPPILYMTLLRETNYWRGTSKSLWLLGWKPSDAKSRPGDEGESCIIEPTDLPLLLQEKPLIDFAYLKLDTLLDIGSSSRVYKGSFRGKTVAVKLFTPPRMDRKAVMRCLKEAKHSALLKHPNIVEFYGLAVQPPDICFVCEYCNKGSLHQVLGSVKLSNKRKLSLMLQASNALSYLHGMNPPYIHRDIKSRNFFVTGRWVLKLGDFGESRVFTKEMVQTPQEYIGSFAYMSPELISSSYYDTKADIYALGIVLWEVLTQERPYSGILEATVLRNVVDATEGGCSLRPKVPRWATEECKDLMKSCWDSDPLKRPTAAQIRMKLILIKDSGGPVDPVYINKRDLINNPNFNSHGDVSSSSSAVQYGVNTDYPKQRNVVESILQAEMKEMEHHAHMLDARKRLLEEQLDIMSRGELDSEGHKQLVRKHLEANSTNAMRIMSRERTGGRPRYDSMGSTYSTFPFQNDAHSDIQYLSDHDSYMPVERQK